MSRDMLPEDILLTCAGCGKVGVECWFPERTFWHNDCVDAWEAFLWAVFVQKPLTPEERVWKKRKREIVVMRHRFGGETFKEIGEAINLSGSTVRNDFGLGLRFFGHLATDGIIRGNFDFYYNWKQQNKHELLESLDQAEQYVIEKEKMVQQEYYADE